MVLFPILLVGVSFLIYKYFKKIPLILLPLLIFISLQFLPLPRSPYHSYGPPNQSERFEPYAVGVGYPLAYLKLYLGAGCIDSILQDDGACGSQRDLNPFNRLSQREFSDGEGKDSIKNGDIVFLPEQMISRPIIPVGLLFYSYIVFFLILFIKNKIK